MNSVTAMKPTPASSNGWMHSQCDVAVIGAGPYGLSAAAHLRCARELDVRIFGEPMSFWTAMPHGMLLRSAWDACHIGFPDGDLTLDSYKSATRQNFGKPVPLDAFIGYGHWFAQHAVPDLDRRHVSLVEPAPGGFRLVLGDGDAIRAARVVVAAGIESFASRPQGFETLSRRHVTHSSEHRDLGAFAGGRVVVIGGGQSALESAALLHESGADVEVISRAPRITWLRGGTIQRRLGRLKPVLYAQTDVGPAGLSRLVAMPRVFCAAPRGLQGKLAYRAIRPAGARWLVDRLASVPITTGRRVVLARPSAGGVNLVLDDGSQRQADHVIVATGYRVDVAGYSFLAPSMVDRIQRIGGYPVLGKGLESSVPGLHFLGAPAAWSYGPTMRFVSGSWYAARTLAESVRESANAG